MSEPAALICTVGGQPQVVTFALDALRARGEAIREVYAVHLSPDRPRLRRSLQRLAEEFVNDEYAGDPCRFRRIPIARAGRPLGEIRSEADADAAWQSVRSLIVELKEQERILHICVAGGRRMVSLLTMAAAALLCDHRDRIWHLYTPDEVLGRVRDGKQMHVDDKDGVVLVQVPLAPWGTYFPALRALAQTPSQLVTQQVGRLQAVDDRLCRQVFAALTPRQRDVLRSFASGRRPQQVAEELDVTLATVNTHKTAILALCRTTWEVDAAEPLDYHFLRERFARFMQRADMA